MDKRSLDQLWDQMRQKYGAFWRNRAGRRRIRPWTPDEFLHHRGQLYTYARLCGAEPPFMWGFAENAPEFRPAR